VLVLVALAAQAADVAVPQASVERGKPRLTYTQAGLQATDTGVEITISALNELALYRKLQVTAPQGTDQKVIAPGQTQPVRVRLAPGGEFRLTERYDWAAYQKDLKAAREALPPGAWKDLVSIGGRMAVEAVFEPVAAARIVAVGQILLNLTEVQPLLEKGDYLKASFAVLGALQASRQLQGEVAAKAGGPWVQVVVAMIKYRVPVGRLVAATMMLALDAAEGPGVTRYAWAGVPPRPSIVAAKAAPSEEMVPQPGPAPGVCTGPVTKPIVDIPAEGATVARKLVVAGRATPESLIVILLDAYDSQTGEFLTTVPGSRRMVEADGTFQTVIAAPLNWQDRDAPLSYKMRVYALSQTDRSEPAVVTLKAAR
jgi:hypothetical protein